MPYQLVAQGGPIVWIIIAMGVAAFVVYVERSLHLHRVRIRAEDFLKGIKTNLPIIIRLAGTNAEEGMRLLASSKLITAETLMEAAEKAVAACPGGKNGHSG